MEKNLQMSLKRKWFEMTKAGIKPEDYRDINDYWCRRLLYIEEYMEHGIWNEMIEDLSNTNRRHENINECMKFFDVKFKQFDYNIMTLGYPSKDDHDRILKLPHTGIEIRTGNPDWGAKPGKLYFVIKHGKQN